MALGAHDALGTAIERVLLITKDGHLAPQLSAIPGVEVLESSHPMPDERSLAAGARLLAWVEALPPAVQPLFLISGGASALTEVLVPGKTLADLALDRITPPPGRVYASLNSRKLEWPDPSELARRDDVVQHFWRESAHMVGFAD